jgi:S-DNA-T family DNA segregation ATPase FtsK/SpoIIIE
VAHWERNVWNTLLRCDIAHQAVDRVRSTQVFTFRLRLADPRNLSKTLTLGEQLALALGVESVRVARHLGYVDVEIALPRGHHRVLPVRALKRKGKAWIALGQTATGTPVHVNLAGNRTCHALVSGMTGSGKTVTERLIAWTLAMDNEVDAVNLLLVDGKGGTAWSNFRREAHLAHPVIGDANEAITALSWCVAELDRRKHNGRHLPRLFVVVDEVRELLDQGGDAVAKAIERIAALGRELGIHVVVATQHPLVDALGGAITKANLPMRLTGRVADAGAAYVATGVKGSGAENLMGNGDFLLTVGGESHRLQVALVGNREMGRLPRREETPRLDLEGHDLDRVLDVVDPPSPKKDLEPEPVAYALATGCGVPAIRERYGPMGTARARRIRDFARAMRAVFPKLGYIHPLPLGTISQETAHRAGVQGLLKGRN